LIQRELLSTKQLTMPVTTDYQVFADRYHFPSEMEARDKKDDIIAKLQASEATLQDELNIADYYQSGVLERISPLLPTDDSPHDIIGDICDEIKKLKEELELSRSFNERFREGHELCEVYKGRCSGMEAELAKLQASEATLQDEVQDTELAEDIAIEILKDERESNKKTISELHEKIAVLKEENKDVLTTNEELNKFYEKITEAIGEHYFGCDGILPKIKELVKAYDFMSICSNWATGVFHLLGEMADVETANKLIATEYMEREEFKEFNPDWADHHD